ncbi:adipokinetic hormone/corazonin-related peptide receptor variant I-like [Hetaerina americana]|uniref:adipokinetic hormone/corazonin-related peptide receptor variant I-like n=1 Tax=Hetaerina americana TaxID=62018 RepID=UPI003A7F6065
MASLSDVLFSPENASGMIVSDGGFQGSGNPWVLPVEECERLRRLSANASGVLGDASSEVSSEGPLGAAALAFEGIPGNVTCLEHAPIFTHSSMIRAIVLGVMALLSLAGNVATIVSIEKSRKHSWSTVYTLILHLSVADLFVTVFCIMGEAGWSYTVEWAAGNVACKVFKFMQMFSLYLSTFVLVLIAVDRFIAVRYPMRSLTAKRCNRYIGIVWGISFVLSIPQVSSG